MKYIAIIILFLLGLVFCMSYSSKDFQEGFDSGNCPNLLVQKGSEIHLVNTNKAEVPGVNPIIFKNLEEYVEYITDIVSVYLTSGYSYSTDFENIKTRAIFRNIYSNSGKFREH